MMTAQPVHPGKTLSDEWLDQMNITVTDAAKALGVSRKTVSAILNGRQRISKQMSIRLGLALGVPSDTWALKQLEYDLATMNRRRIRVKRLTPANFAGEVQ